MSLVHFFFGFTGRINRQQFWLGLLALMLVGVVVVSLLEPEAVRDAKMPKQSLALTTWDLFTCWPNAAIVIKRFNDRNHPSWIGQLLVVAFVLMILANHLGYLRDVNDMASVEKVVFAVVMMFFIWAVIDAGFVPGTTGGNRFGPDPSNRPCPDEHQA